MVVAATNQPDELDEQYSGGSHIFLKWATLTKVKEQRYSELFWKGESWWLHELWFIASLRESFIGSNVLLCKQAAFFSIRKCLDEGKKEGTIHANLIIISVIFNFLFFLTILKYILNSLNSKYYFEVWSHVILQFKNRWWNSYQTLLASQILYLKKITIFAWGENCLI
jgi:hypothetical protein